MISGRLQVRAEEEGLADAVAAYIPLDYQPSSAAPGVLSHDTLLQSIAATFACLGPAACLQLVLTKVTSADG